MNKEEAEKKVIEAAAQDERVASEAWVLELGRRNPRLVGDYGRPPSRTERRLWERMSEKYKMDLLALKIRYARSGFKTHMLKYLELRSKCGYVEGVVIPRWLISAGKT